MNNTSIWGRTKSRPAAAKAGVCGGSEDDTRWPGRKARRKGAMRERS